MSDHPGILKSYHNRDFLNSPQARPIRILSEYLEPRTRLERHGVRDTVVFFGSARFVDAETAQRMADSATTEEEKIKAKQMLDGAPYYEDARKLGFQLTTWASERPDSGPGPRSRRRRRESRSSRRERTSPVPERAESAGCASRERVRERSLGFGS